MNILFHLEIDYVFFFYGFSCLLLAFSTVWMSRIPSGRLQWKWLGLFALTQGIHAWSEMLIFSLGDTIYYSSARLVILGFSSLFLLEFGRSGTVSLSRNIPSRWIYAPIILFSLLGTFGGTAGLNASICYIIGLPGSLWAAWAFFLYYRKDYPEFKSLLLTAAIMFLYALSEGILALKAFSLPSSFMNEASFISAVALAVHLIRGIFITLLGIHIWVHYWFAYCLLFPDLKQIYRIRDIIWFSGVLTAVLALGWVGTIKISAITKENLNNAHLNSAQTLASAINPSQILNLTGSMLDAVAPDFINLREQLKSAKNINQKLRFIYLLALKNNKIIFLADAEPVDSKDYSPPGMVYDEAPPALIKVFSDALPMTIGPYTDRWGTWFSNFVPVKDRESKRAVAVLGQDIDVRNWDRIIFRARIATIFMTFLVTIIVVGFFLLHQRDRESTVQITGSEARYRSLVECSPNTVCLFDQEGRFLSLNQSGLVILGCSQEHVIGKSFSEIWPQSTRPIVENALRQVKKGDRTAFAGKFIRPDNSFVIWYFVLNPILEKDNSIRSCVGIGIDITEQKQAEAEREKLIGELTTALDNVKTLKGLVPICAACKKIRDDKGYWDEIEEYIERRSDAEFTHGICPECAKKLYPDHYKD